MLKLLKKLRRFNTSPFHIMARRGPILQIDLPSAQKFDGIARRRLENDGHVENPS